MSLRLRRGFGVSRCRLRNKAGAETYQLLWDSKRLKGSSNKPETRVLGGDKIIWFTPYAIFFIFCFHQRAAHAADSDPYLHICGSIVGQLGMTLMQTDVKSMKSASFGWIFKMKFTLRKWKKGRKLRELSTHTQLSCARCLEISQSILQSKKLNN